MLQCTFEKGAVYAERLPIEKGVSHAEGQGAGECAHAMAILEIQLITQAAQAVSRAHHVDTGVNPVVDVLDHLVDLLHLGHFRMRRVHLDEILRAREGQRTTPLEEDTVPRGSSCNASGAAWAALGNSRVAPWPVCR